MSHCMGLERRGPAARSPRALPLRGDFPPSLARAQLVQTHPHKPHKSGSSGIFLGQAVVAGLAHAISHDVGSVD